MSEKPGSDSHKNKALKIMATGSLLAFFGLIADHGLGYITRIVLARGLTPSEYGILFLVLSFISIGIQISVLGLPGAVERYVSYYHGKGDNKKVRGAINSAFKMSVPIAIVVFAVLFLLSDVLAYEVFGNPVLSPLIKILSFAVLSAPFIRLSLSVTLAYRSMKYDFLIKVLFKSILTLVILFIALYYGFRVLGAGFAYMIGFIMTGALTFYFMRRKVNVMTSNDKRYVSMKRKLLSFSMPLVFAGFVWAILGQTDTIILGLFRSEVEVGLYNVVLPNAKLLIIVPAAVYALLLPTISALFAKKRVEDIRSIYRTVARFGFNLNFPLLLILLTFPNEVITLFFGSKYLIIGTIGLTQSLLAIGFFIYSFSRISTSVINLYERTKLMLLNSILALSSNVVLDILLVPTYGILGAAIASVISFVFFSLLNLVESFYLSRIHPFDISIIKSIIAGTISMILIWIISSLFLGTANPLYFIIWVLVFFFVYSLMMVIAGCVWKEDIYLLRMIESRLGIKLGWLIRIISRFSK